MRKTPATISVPIVDAWRAAQAKRAQDPRIEQEAPERGAGEDGETYEGPRNEARVVTLEVVPQSIHRLPRFDSQEGV